jgi:hypothetical protein
VGGQHAPALGPGALSAIVNNIPYVATMAPVTATLIQDLQGDGDPTVLWWSLALGADLGGNATAIGAGARPDRRRRVSLVSMLFERLLFQFLSW